MQRSCTSKQAELPPNSIIPECEKCGMPRVLTRRQVTQDNDSGYIDPKILDKVVVVGRSPQSMQQNQFKVANGNGEQQLQTPPNTPQFSQQSVRGHGFSQILYRENGHPTCHSPPRPNHESHVPFLPDPKTRAKLHGFQRERKQLLEGLSRETGYASNMKRVDSVREDAWNALLEALGDSDREGGEVQGVGRG
jgi:hypothetical protein